MLVELLDDVKQYLLVTEFNVDELVSNLVIEIRLEVIKKCLLII